MSNYFNFASLFTTVVEVATKHQNRIIFPFLIQHTVNESTSVKHLKGKCQDLSYSCDLNNNNTPH